MAAKTGSYRPPRAGKYTPTAPMRHATAKSMRKMAADLKTRHPDLGSSEHVTDAAKALDRGDHEAAIRHLNAAIGNMTPQSLRRHGLLTDDQHDDAKRSMDAIHRHLLLVKDVQETHQRNQQLPYAGDQHDDDLTVAPTARQPGRTAMNAPGAQNDGGSDPNTARPQQVTSEARTKQIAASSSGDLTVTLELAGPKGYIHGWKFVGPGKPRDPGYKPPAQPGGEKSEFHSATYSPGSSTPTKAWHGTEAAARKGSGSVPAKYKEHVDVYQRDVQEHSNLADIIRSVELSAQTARLAVQPHPFGKPGGPGLWNVKGMQLPPYVQNIAHALLRTGRAKDLGSAIAIARAATRKWEHGKNTRPEVRAASAGADAEWRSKQAIAHAHANAQLAAKVIELVGPKGYVHGFKYVGGPGLPSPAAKRAGLPKADRATIAASKRTQFAAARGTMTAPAGSHGHAEELRNLAREADRHQGENYASVHNSREGMTTDTALQTNAGLSKTGPTESDTARALRRSAQMIDAGQPSLARLHSGFIRSQANSELLNPGYASKLNAAAAKLEQLPRGQGLAATPPATAAFRQRTGQAQRYAGSMGFSNAAIAAKVIELTGTSAGAAKDPRTVTGQFGQGGQKNQKPDAHQQHVAHVQHLKTVAGKRAAINGQISSNNKKISALVKQRQSYQSALASASGKTSSGQSGSKTSSNATTASSTPASTSSTASSSSASSTSGSSASASGMSTSQISSQITAINSQIKALQAANAKLAAQAKAL